MSSGYPKNLQYLVKRISNYSKNTVRLQTLNQTTATNGQIITVDLPSNALVDLNSLTMFFTGTTSTTSGFATFPRNIETLLERVEVEVNGQVINGGCQYYNQLWQVVADTTIGEDATNRRKILQNASDVAVPAANVSTGVQFCIQNWLGFLGSCKPSVLDSSLLGNVRVRLTLTGPQALVTSSGTAGAGYTLSNIFFTCDVLSIDDGVFYSLHQQFLQGGGVYELPYHNYYSFTSTGGLSQTTKFSLSTQSLNRVWGCFVLGNSYPMGSAAANGAAFDANANTSSYFTRIGNAGTAIPFGTTGNNTPITYAITNYQWSVNGTYFPNFKPSPEQAYALLQTALNMSQDTLGGGYKGLDTLAKWNSSFWLCSQEFEHGSDDYISGLDTRGNVAQAFLETGGSITVGANVGTGGTNPGTSLTCLVFAQCTSLLRVGAGRQLEVVL